MSTFPKAEILYADDELCVVICPFCKAKHKHGIVQTGDARASDCHKGDYLIGETIQDELLLQALTSLRKERARKIEYRAKIKAQLEELKQLKKNQNPTRE